MTDEKNMLDLEALQEQLQALDDADLDLIDGGKLTGGQIAGIVTGAALATAAIIGIPTALYVKKKRKASAPNQATAETNGTVTNIENSEPVPNVEIPNPDENVEELTTAPVNYPQPTGDFYFDVPPSSDPSSYKRLFDKLT